MSRSWVSFEQAHRERQALRISELGARVGERVEVVADLLDVGVGRGALLGALVRFEREEVDERRLGPLDLRGEDGLLADEGVDEPVERRHHLAGQLEPDERLLGGAESFGEHGVHDDRRIRGGSACGTKAAISSPPTVVRSYRPVVRFGIVGLVRRDRLSGRDGSESRRDRGDALGTNSLLAPTS